MSNQATRSIEPVGQYALKFFEKGVKQELKASAALNDRSMNQEILYLIKRGQEVVAREKQGAGA